MKLGLRLDPPVTEGEARAALDVMMIEGSMFANDLGLNLWATSMAEMAVSFPSLTEQERTELVRERILVSFAWWRRLNRFQDHHDKAIATALDELSLANNQIATLQGRLKQLMGGE